MTGPSLDEVGPDAVHESRGAPENRTGHGELGACGDTALASGPAQPVGPSLDLDALREKAEYDKLDGEPFTRVIPDQILAVLALVEEQRDRISTIEEALRMLRREHVLFPGATDPIAEDIVRQVDEALAGSPAENKEPT